MSEKKDVLEGIITSNIMGYASIMGQVVGKLVGQDNEYYHVDNALYVSIHPTEGIKILPISYIAEGNPESGLSLKLRKNTVAFHFKLHREMTIAYLATIGDIKLEAEEPPAPKIEVVPANNIIDMSKTR